MPPRPSLSELMPRDSRLISIRKGFEIEIVDAIGCRDNGIGRQLGRHRLDQNMYLFIGDGSKDRIADCLTLSIGWVY